MNETILRALVDLRDKTLQKSRIAFGNRVSAIERQADNPPDDVTGTLFEKYSMRFQILEDEVTKDIEMLVKPIPIVGRLTKLKGIGFTLAAKLVSMIDIKRADTISALWRYCGYAVIGGERERPIKGEKLHYNIRLKSTCYLIAVSFLKVNSPYRQIYDAAKEKYEMKDWPQARKHNAALRKMTKIFLSHLWLTWRILENLPTSDPYVEEVLGHNHITKPEDYGW